MKMKIGSSLMALVFGMGFWFAAGVPHGHGSQRRPYLIGVNIWKEGRIYENTLRGMLDGLKEVGFHFKTVVLRSYKSKKKAKANFEKLVEKRVDLIVSFGSAGARIVHKMVKDIPVLVHTINHPVALGIAKSVESSGNNITGVSYFVDPAKQLRFYKQVMPKLNKIGLLYDVNNPAGALAEMPATKKAAKELGIDFFPIGIKSRDEIEPAIRAAVGKVDAFTVATNKLVYQDIQKVLKVTDRLGIPVFSLSKVGVESGAIAALYGDTYKLGRLSVGQIVDILKRKKSPSEIPFRFIESPDIALNLEASLRVQVEFPVEILDVATVVHRRQVGAEVITETGQRHN